MEVYVAIKWQNKYKKQPCKIYKGDELVQLAASKGFSVDLEKIAEDLRKKCKHSFNVATAEPDGTFKAMCSKCGKSTHGHFTSKDAKAALKA
jgi:hypothetical protein